VKKEHIRLEFLPKLFIHLILIFLKLFQQKDKSADSLGLLLPFVLFKGSYCRPFVECLRLFL